MREGNIEGGKIEGDRNERENGRDEGMEGGRNGETNGERKEWSEGVRE